MTDKLLDILNHKLYKIVEAGLLGRTGRIFGAAILSREGTFILGASNSIYSTKNSLMHAEIQAITLAEELNKVTIGLSDYILLATHEPCPLCLAGAYWAKIPEIHYLFTYEETTIKFDMPEDIDMCMQLFGRAHPVENNDLIKINRIRQPVDRVSYIKRKYKELYDNFFLKGEPRNEPKT